MEHITTFLNKYDYLLPLLCVLTIVLLIATTLSLLNDLRKSEDRYTRLLHASSTEKLSGLKHPNTDMIEYWKNLHDKLASDYAILKNDYSNLQESFNQLQQKCEFKSAESKFKIRDFNLQNENNNKSLKHIASEAEKYVFSKSKESALKDHFFKHAHQFYRLRDTPVMYDSESIMFKAICNEINREEYSLKHDGDIIVFPQVSLHSVFSLTEEGKKNNPDEYFSRQYISKSVDFLLCRCIENSISYFQPILGIEIDGSSHLNEDQKEKDRIKDELFEATNLPLLRFSLQNINCTESEQQRLVQEIRRFLL